MSRSSPEATADATLTAQLLRLLEHAEGHRGQLDKLLAEAQQQRMELAALLEGIASARLGREEVQLAELLARLEAGFEAQAELSEQVAKLTRTQFKANSLGEMQGERLARALSTLQELIKRRDSLHQEQQEMREQERRDLRAAGRRELAVELLPALDGLESALASASSLLQRLEGGADPAPAGTAPAEGGLWRRLFGGGAGRANRLADAAELQDSLGAWIQGLELVRARFVKLLEGESISAVEPLGEMFDPRAHVAVETRPEDAAAGTVVGVPRKGYVLRDGRVLRYAEVVVAERRESGSGDGGSHEDGSHENV